MVLIETFKQLHSRLSKGCGREKCKFEACLNNPSKIKFFILNPPINFLALKEYLLKWFI